jgi:hypothetical protein
MESYQIDAPKQAKGADSFALASSFKLPGIENFFCKNAFHRKATPFLGQKPFLDRFLGEGA